MASAGAIMILAGLIVSVKASRTGPVQQNPAAGITAMVFFIVGILAPFGGPVVAQSSDTDFDLEAWLREQAVAYWGELSPQEARHTYLRQVPGILDEYVQVLHELNTLTKDYLAGNVSGDEMRDRTMDLGTYTSDTLDTAYLLTVLAPDDEELGTLDASLNDLQGSVGNVAWMVGDDVERGRPPREIKIELDSISEYWSRTSELLESLIADYRRVNPKEADILREKIHSIVARFAEDMQHQ